MATTWGDPTTDTFRKRHIREARAAGAEALVNAQIEQITARLIEGLSNAHVEIPERIVSFDENGTEHQRLGLALHLAIPAPPSPDVAAVVQDWLFDGFRVEGSDLIELRFVGTPESAASLTEAALALAIDRVDDEEVSGKPPVHWPGSRDLVLGDSGHDVRFLHLLLGTGEATEPVNARLIAAVRLFQERRGAPVTGVIDADLWRRLLPHGRPQIGQSDSGFVIRVIQAALATYEDATTKVTGVWGTLTTRDLTAMQREYNLRVGSFVRAPEWALLLGPENPRLIEARNRALSIGSFAVPEPVEVPDPPKTTGGRIGGFATDGRFGGKLGLTHQLTPIQAEIVKNGGITETSINGVDTEHLISDEHKPVQHRDGKEPWCNVCKLTAAGHLPTRKKVDPKAPPKKRSTPVSAPKKS